MLTAEQARILSGNKPKEPSLELLKQLAHIEKAARKGKRKCVLYYWHTEALRELGFTVEFKSITGYTKTFPKERGCSPETRTSGTVSW